MENMVKTVARAICKSRTCEGLNCCQWPCNGGRWHDPLKQSVECRVDQGRYDDAARDAIEAIEAIRQIVPSDFRTCPPGHMLFPLSRHEAEVMNCVSERFLKDHALGQEARQEKP